MKLTEENQDGMDCRPPTGRNTGIVLSASQQKSHEEAVARRAASRKGLLAQAERMAAEVNRPILFLKAVIPGGAMGDLLRPVNVAGYVRDGKWVPTHQAMRHVRGDAAPAAMQHTAMTPGDQPHIVRPVVQAPKGAPEAAQAIVERAFGVAVKPAPLSDTQKRKLAALQNYATRYETVVTHADGTRHLLGYTPRKSTAGLVDVVHKHGPRLSGVLGLAADANMKAAGKHEMHIDGGHKVHFSGRTQRDAILEGEHPHILDVPTAKERAATKAAELAATPPDVRSPGLPLPQKSVEQMRDEQIAAYHAASAAKAKGLQDGYWARASLRGKKPQSHDTGIHPTREAAAAAAWREAGAGAWGVSTSPARGGAKTHSDIQFHDKPAMGRPPVPLPASDAKHFYVSAIDGSKKHLVAGPYGSHDEAKGMVEHVRRHATERDSWSHFMAWGTAGSSSPLKTPLGEKWKPPA